MSSLQGCTVDDYFQGGINLDRASGELEAFTVRLVRFIQDGAHETPELIVVKGGPWHVEVRMGFVLTIKYASSPLYEWSSDPDDGVLESVRRLEVSLVQAARMDLQNLFMMMVHRFPFLVDKFSPFVRAAKLYH